MEILDFYHAAEHLAVVAHAVWGEDTPAAQAWWTHQRATLLQAAPASLFAALTVLALYFVKRISRLSARKFPHRSGGEIFAGVRAYRSFMSVGHAVALAVEQQEIAMVRQAVNHRRHLVVGEDPPIWRTPGSWSG